MGRKIANQHDQENILELTSAMVPVDEEDQNFYLHTSYIRESLVEIVSQTPQVIYSQLITNSS